MTFLVTVYTNEAIVMAADSRITYNPTSHYSDTAQKLFVTDSGVGISTCGTADFNGHLIQEYLASFCKQHSESDVEEVKDSLRTFFQEMGANINTTFYVAGYSKVENSFVQKVYKIQLNGTTTLVNNAPGAAWDGQTDIISRLFTDVYVKRTDGSGKDTYAPHSGFNTEFVFFTIQDAIDFATTSMDIVKGMLRLQNRQVNVGGPTDILLITPDGFKWIAHKELHA